MGRGRSVHCGMLGILLIVEPSVASRAFWRTRHVQKRSNLTLLVLQRSKTKQNVKTALVRLAFLINTHQSANQWPIGSAPHTGCSVHFHPSRFTRPWFFEGMVPRLHTHLLQGYSPWQLPGSPSSLQILTVPKIMQQEKSWHKWYWTASTYPYESKQENQFHRKSENSFRKS